jgi:hypothetical protein
MVKEENFMLVSEMMTEEVPAVEASEEISEAAVEAENTMTSKKVEKEEDHSMGKEHHMMEKEDHMMGKEHHMMEKEDLMIQIDLEEEVVIEAVELVKEE